MSDQNPGGMLNEAREALGLNQPRAMSSLEAINLGNRLAAQGLFDYASAVIDVTRRRETAGSEPWIKLGQKLAFFTSRDTRLPVRERLGAALEILNECGLATTDDQETLGLAGSIYKRRWEQSRRLEDLQQAANFYGRGLARGIGSDGYVAINAAFLLDLLASEFERQQLPAPCAELREKAKGLRHRIVAELGAKLDESNPVDESRWWSLATLIEAYVGMGDIEGTKRALTAARAVPSAAWQRESTLRQVVGLIAIAAIDSGKREALLAALREFYPHVIEALRVGPPGKLGLALSGGGFRAALFHLGVLARLAEADVLRHVQVLSCVSGGSIVGAHYFLLLRQLLQEKPDAQITREDYIRLVRELMERFCKGTKENVRMRSLSNVWANLRMLLSRRYTRADRVAELYDQYFFSLTPGAAPGQRHLMREIGILPAGYEAGTFNPDRDNWGRRNKAPSLVLNATTLNTGHGWQFTPARLGEIRFARERVDANPHLQSLFYDQAPPEHRDMPLSRAVAASSCVPALFPPVRMLELYPDKLVALVDGAIHDNQGVAGLLAEDCRSLLVSDGAGHMDVMDRVPLGYLPVAARTMGILQTRLREAQFRELSAMNQLGTVELLFLHLKQGLTPKTVGWAGCDIRAPGAVIESDDMADSTTPYGILPQVQQLLARMRTDLDAFSDIEANALMFDGYQIAGHYLSGLKWVNRREAACDSAANQEPWPFMRITGMMSGQDAAGTERLIRHLRAGAKRGGKWLRLSRFARHVGWVAAVIALACIVMALHGTEWRKIEHGVVRIVMAGMGVYALVLAIALIAQYRPRSGNMRTGHPAISQSIADVAIFLFGWIALIDIALIRRAYLRLGEMKEPVTPSNPQGFVASAPPEASPLADV